MLYTLVVPATEKVFSIMQLKKSNNIMKHNKNYDTQFNF